MKKKLKIGMLFTALGSTLGLSSCKKAWICECTDNSTGSKYDINVDYGEKLKKSDAKKKCDAIENNRSFDATCSLK